MSLAPLLAPVFAVVFPPFLLVSELAVVAVVGDPPAPGTAVRKTNNTAPVLVWRPAFFVRKLKHSNAFCYNEQRNGGLSANGVSRHVYNAVAIREHDHLLEGD